MFWKIMAGVGLFTTTVVVLTAGLAAVKKVKIEIVNTTTNH